MINVNLLPKNLRRRREPGYWRLIALAFPVLVLAVLAVVQISRNQTATSLDNERGRLEIRLQTFQDDVREQRELQARQRQLNEIIAIASAVREGRVEWSGEVVRMLETIPPQAGAPRPLISFDSLNMRAISGQSGNYENVDPNAEFNISGQASGLDALAAYVRALQDSPTYGVAFSNANLVDSEDQPDYYQFNLTIGAVTGQVEEEDDTDDAGGGSN
ncbi:MAG: hypothetical protein U5L04_11080 [Trueperaceae bacterium]|nr:hypothetical protein [Trueperaceae bacterium]